MRLAKVLQACAFFAFLAMSLIAHPALTFAAESSTSSTSAPTQAPTPQASIPSSEDEEEEWEDAHQQQENFEHRYGSDRDIVAPPLLVKKSAAGSSKYVTQPIRVNRPDSQGFPLGGLVKPEMMPRAFNGTSNQPVINNISVHGYSSPAEEFAAKAYLGMGMLALVALVLGGVVAVRYRNRGNAMDDFDLFDQPPGSK